MANLFGKLKMERASPFRAAPASAREKFRYGSFSGLPWAVPTSAHNGIGSDSSRADACCTDTRPVRGATFSAENGGEIYKDEVCFTKLTAKLTICYGRATGVGVSTVVSCSVDGISQSAGRPQHWPQTASHPLNAPGRFDKSPGSYHFGWGTT
ncbi:hypothetical protein [Rudaea sp.]|uniref:hypothetical protein n=1 Tax=Rudaea sp. TaxID=2136325 RepID=UPI002ED1AFB6